MEEKSNWFRHAISILVFIAGVYANANLLALLLLIAIIEYGF